MRERPKGNDGAAARRVLALGVPADWMDEGASGPLRIDRTAYGGGALLLCHHAAYDMLLVRQALPDMGLALFMAELRSSAPGRRLPVVFLADAPAHVELARPWVRPGLDLLSPADSVRALAAVAARLLGVAPRNAARLLAAPSQPWARVGQAKPGGGSGHDSVPLMMRE